jgi:formate hydrogenlyase transcriptional activator
MNERVPGLDSVVLRIQAVRARVPARRCALIVISGIDGSGKGWVAERLRRALLERDIGCAVIGVDGWLNPPAVRFSPLDPGEHFYRHALRLDELRTRLVEPLRARRTIRLEAELAEETAQVLRPHVYECPDLDLILLEGIFLLKREHRFQPNLSLWVDCSFETALERAIARAQEGLSPEETAHACRTIYFPAQRIHLERDDPRGAADVFLATDPRMIATRYTPRPWRACTAPAWSESPMSHPRSKATEPTGVVPDERPYESDDDILRRILEGTARATGEEFFRSLVRNLGMAIRTAYAFIAEVSADRKRVRTLAVWGKGRFLDDFEYDLDGTPCEEVIRGELCHHPRGVQARFPRDLLLVEMGVESFLGVPLLNDRGQVLGHMAVLDTRPMSDEPRRLSIFRIFAARAAAELERVRIQKAMIESEQRLRDLFDEAPIGYVYEDTQTRFLSANRAAQQILGLRPEEVPSTVGLTLVAPTQEAQERVHDSLKSEQAGQEKPYIVLELRRKDNGKPVWIQRFSRPEPDGKHTRTMLVDITAQVLAERERARLSQHNTYLREEIKSEYNFEEIIGSSAGLRGALAKVKHVAPTDSTVLIQGETGTGKELIARALHSNSRRKDRPFIKLNCAALPAGLIESELFGHEKGAFTGALEKRVGRFALADGGTIFLDEIGDVPMDVQVRMLRVLQEQEFEPVGSPRTLKVDVRVIAATNRDLADAVKKGDFRADLFYRLNVFPILVPPLRQRRDDVPLLAHYFIAKYAAKIGKRVEAVADETMRRLLEYPWPGNIRELENVIERAVILSLESTLVIDPAVLSVETRRPAAVDQERVDGGAGVLTAAENERAHIRTTLERVNWRVEGERGAARVLGLHPNTLRSRMKRLGIQRGS